MGRFHNRRQFQHQRLVEERRLFFNHFRDQRTISPRFIWNGLLPEGRGDTSRIFSFFLPGSAPPPILNKSMIDCLYMILFPRLRTFYFCHQLLHDIELSLHRTSCTLFLACFRWPGGGLHLVGTTWNGRTSRRSSSLPRLSYKTTGTPSVAALAFELSVSRGLDGGYSKSVDSDFDLLDTLHQSHGGSRHSSLNLFITRPAQRDIISRRTYTTRNRRHSLLSIRIRTVRFLLASRIR